jgi:epoxyqueuosine reductase
MAIRRIGHWRWQRNLVVALGNRLANKNAGKAPALAGKAAGEQEARRALASIRTQADPILAEHIEWALQR